MAKIVTNKRNGLFDDEYEVEELGAETEAEKQMKVILEKQLNTKISLKEQFSQHRSFVTPSTFKSIVELVHGTCSLEKFKEIEKNEELRQELQRCGLTNDEVTDYLISKSGKVRENKLLNPAIESENIKKIEDKIKAHNEALQKPQEFASVKKLTRHEMDIESTLYRGCSEKSKLSSLVSVQKTTDMDETFSHIKAISDKLLEKCRRKRKRKKLENKDQNETTDCHTLQKEGIQYDPNIHHVTVPLEESEILEKRLSVEEIKHLPRFEKYYSGQPSKTLYVKNLHPKLTVDELRSVFGSFEEENGYPICYKLCTGRMKGQAFVTFSNSSVSEKALQFANGYILREKPIIIEFGKKS